LLNTHTTTPAITVFYLLISQNGMAVVAHRDHLALIIEVLAARTQGIDRSDRDTVLSLLSVVFAPGEDGTGRVLLVLAGDGVIALEVEALEVTLKDVTRPYLAPSGKVPGHDL